MATPMTLEGCAEMRAEMDAGRLRDDVLARAGVGVDEWVVAQREWLDKMGTDLERGRFELTNRYTRAFLDRQRALKAATPPLLGGAAREMDAETLPPQAGIRTPELAPWRSPAPAADGPAALPFTPAAPLPVASGASTSSTPNAAPFFPEVWPQRKPVEEAASEPAPIPPLRAPSEAAVTARVEPSWASSTSWLQPSPIPRDPLPFQAKATPAAPAAAATPPPRSPIVPTAPAAIPPVAPDAKASAPADRPDWATSTTGVGPSVLRAALPFLQARPAPGSPPVAPAAPPPAPRPISLSSSTSSVQSPVGALQPEVAPKRAPPPVPPHAKPAPAAAPPLPPPRPAAPPRPPAAAGQPARATWTAIDSGLSLEQHASLCVEIALDPARTAEALARYRLTAERKAELDLLWKARFSGDPALEVKWREAYRLYSDFLAARRP